MEGKKKEKACAMREERRWQLSYICSQLILTVLLLHVVHTVHDLLQAAADCSLLIAQLSYFTPQAGLQALFIAVHMMSEDHVYF